MQYLIRIEEEYILHAQPVIRIEEGYILHAILARGWVGGPSNPAIFCKNRMQCKTGEALDTGLRRYRGGINLLLG